MIERDSIGKYLSEVAEALIRNDNKTCKIAVAGEISNGNAERLCREEIQANKTSSALKWGARMLKVVALATEMVTNPRSP